MFSGGSATSVPDDQLTKCGTNGGGPLGLIVSLLTSSPISLDIAAQIDLLQLAGNLFAGFQTQSYPIACVTCLHLGSYFLLFCCYFAIITCF